MTDYPDRLEITCDGKRKPGDLGHETVVVYYRECNFELGLLKGAPSKSAGDEPTVEEMNVAFERLDSTTLECQIPTCRFTRRIKDEDLEQLLGQLGLAVHEGRAVMGSVRLLKMPLI